MPTDIQDHVLFHPHRSATGSFIWKAKEGDFLVPDGEILVLWKQSLHRLPTKQIGDGMSVVVHRARQDSLQVDTESLLRGMSIYQEYDEHKNTWQTYLYKYGGDEEAIQRINSLFICLSLSGYQVKKIGRFVQLQGAVSSGLFGQEFVETLQHKSITALSFFLGCCIAYGRPVSSSLKELVTRQVTIPYVGSIVEYDQIFGHLIHQLAGMGIFVVTKKIEQSLGSLLQITIQDWEVLSLLQQFLFANTIAVPRIDYFQSVLRGMVNEMLLEKDGKPLSTNSVLKIVSK